MGSALRMMAAGLMFFAIALLPGEAMARTALFVINPIDNQTATATAAFQYQVRYTVIDQACWAGRISFHLMNAPAGMTITEGGNITWTPSASEIGGSYGVVVHASALTPEASPCSGYPGRDTNSFVITVTAPPPPSPLSLKVLTYNIYMRPDSVFSDDQYERAELISTVVSGYDVIVFEEAFDDDVRAVLLLFRLAAEYPYRTRILGKDRFLEQDGGVVIVSKWPIEREVQRFFTSCAGWDCTVEKGVMYARLNVNGKPVHIFGTHTQADRPGLGAAGNQRSIRRQQLVSIRSLIESLAIPADQPVLIAGDLNVNLYTMTEYPEMLNILSATHPPAQSIDGWPFYTHDPKNSYVPDDSEPKYLDYVLYSNNHLKPDRAFNDVRIFMPPPFPQCYFDGFCGDLSDHYAVEGNFTFSGTGSGAFGTFPSVAFFEGNAAPQDFICSVSMKYETQLDFTRSSMCTHDGVLSRMLYDLLAGRVLRDMTAGSLILYDVPAGRVLRLFDDSYGSFGDDWVEIIAKRNIARKMIATFERSFEDEDVRVTYYSHNGLDGKVSRLEVHCLDGCSRYPTIIQPRRRDPDDYPDDYHGDRTGVVERIPIPRDQRPTLPESGGPTIIQPRRR